MTTPTGQTGGGVRLGLHGGRWRSDAAPPPVFPTDLMAPCIAGKEKPLDTQAGAGAGTPGSKRTTQVWAGAPALLAYPGASAVISRERGAE